MDSAQLAFDVLSTTVFLATPAVLWLFLFLVAWEDPRIARESGFGRRTFWLLVPVGWIASVLVALPFFGWDGDVLAINLAGGLFPLILSLLFLHRLLAPEARSLGRFLIALAGETALLFAVVVGVTNSEWADLAALGICIAVPTGVGFLEARAAGAGPRAAALPLALTSLVLYLTFLTTAAVAGVGIESIFPFYLLAPIAAGVVAVPIVVQRWHQPPGASLALAYATTTLGTLIGADILRQPPLYGAGGPYLLSIGGAGLLDLLYLSGLLAAATAYVFLRFFDRSRATASDTADAVDPGLVRTPTGRLREALELGIAGHSVASAAASAVAADEAAAEARRLLEAPPAPPSDAWAGLGVPPWVAADHRNLRALAASGTADAVDAGRAWTTSHWLVRLGRELGQRRLASAARRGAAFGLDLAVTLPPAVLFWVVIGLTNGGGLNAFSNSVAFVAAIIGYPSYAFLYLVIAEAATGTTVGKWILGLEVTDRTQRRPGPISVLVRNVPKLIPLEFVGIAGALITALLFAPAGSTSMVSGGGIYLGLTAILATIVLTGAVLLALLVGWAGIQISPERQRVGDYLAGTWVLHRPPTGSPP